MPDSVLEPKVASAIQSAVRELDYGAVEITVHDSRVVQIDVRRRIRFEKKKESPDNRD